MKQRENAARGQTGDDGRAVRRNVPSWINWQSALYLLVLGLVCTFLAPLTSFWWIVPVLGAVVPIALAVLDEPSFASRKSDDRKVKERELLKALVELGEITPTTTAMWTSLTVDEASEMLEELARKGHLKPRIEGGIMAYALPLEAKTEGDEAPRRLQSSQWLDDPLSEREIEVLSLLASGRTNSEVARDLFVSVGTVKSHTSNIYRKLDAKNRAEALARARELKVLQ
jgi:DNA-binding CsgD family transcriptional regulator